MTLFYWLLSILDTIDGIIVYALSLVMDHDVARCLMWAIEAALFYTYIWPPLKVVGHAINNTCDAISAAVNHVADRQIERIKPHWEIVIMPHLNRWRDRWRERHPPKPATAEDYDRLIARCDWALAEKAKQALATEKHHCVPPPPHSVINLNHREGMS
jgi:hypothetical protein